MYLSRLKMKIQHFEKIMFYKIVLKYNLIYAYIDKQIPNNIYFIRLPVQILKKIKIK